MADGTGLEAPGRSQVGVNRLRLRALAGPHRIDYPDAPPARLEERGARVKLFLLVIFPLALILLTVVYHFVTTEEEA